MAETSGLLNRRTGFTRTEGSNPSVSASALSKPLILLNKINGSAGGVPFYLQSGLLLIRPSNGCANFNVQFDLRYSESTLQPAPRCGERRFVKTWLFAD